MPLQQFVEQAQANKNAASKTVYSEPLQHKQNDQKQVSPRANTGLGAPKIANDGGREGHLTPQEVRDTSKLYNQNPLPADDQKMLCSIAAVQIRYGRPAEAIPYLMMVRKVNQQNVDCVRLLALAFMRMKRWQEADAMVSELEKLTNHNQVQSGMLFLYKSIVSFKNQRLQEAQSCFQRFRNIIKISLQGDQS